MRKFKKAIAVALALSMIFTTGCSSSKSSNSNNQESANAPSSDVVETSSNPVDISNVKLLSDGVLSVGCEVGYPPFEDFAEDGTTPIGYDVDIITEVAKRLGLKVNIINTAWDGIFAGIDHNYDVACSAVTINEERKETMLFSTPYINNYQAIILPKGSTQKISGFNDLDGMTVALQKETTSDELISDYKSTGTIEVEIIANEKITSCFTQLTNGEVDAVVVDSTVADGFIASSPDKYEMVFKDDKEPEQFGIAMGLKNTELKKAIDTALADMEADGFIQETYDYWFGSSEEN